MKENILCNDEFGTNLDFGIFFFDNLIVGEGEIWILNVSVGKTRRCQLIELLKALGGFLVLIERELIQLFYFYVCGRLRD